MHYNNTNNSKNKIAPNVADSVDNNIAAGACQ
jgi:hypothetical protein